MTIAIPITLSPTCCGTRLVGTRGKHDDKIATVEFTVQIGITRPGVFQIGNPEIKICRIDTAVHIDVEIRITTGRTNIGHQEINVITIQKIISVEIAFLSRGSRTWFKQTIFNGNEIQVIGTCSRSSGNAERKRALTTTVTSNTRCHVKSLTVRRTIHIDSHLMRTWAIWSSLNIDPEFVPLIHVGDLDEVRFTLSRVTAIFTGNFAIQIIHQQTVFAEGVYTLFRSQGETDGTDIERLEKANVSRRIKFDHVLAQATCGPVINKTTAVRIPLINRSRRGSRNSSAKRKSESVFEEFFANIVQSDNVTVKKELTITGVTTNASVRMIAWITRVL